MQSPPSRTVYQLLIRTPQQRTKYPSRPAKSMNMAITGNRYMTPDQEMSHESAAFAVIAQRLREPALILADPSGIYIAGIFPTTPMMTHLVCTVSPKVQLVLKFASRGLVTAVPMEDLVYGSAELSKALETLMVMYQEVYHPRVRNVHWDHCNYFAHSKYLRNRSSPRHQKPASCSTNAESTSKSSLQSSSISRAPSASNTTSSTS
jgi:hypothetical protein